MRVREQQRNEAERRRRGERLAEALHEASGHQLLAHTLKIPGARPTQIDEGLLLPGPVHASQAFEPGLAFEGHRASQPGGLHPGDGA